MASAGSAGGNAFFPKVWSSTVVCKDASGKIVAKMSREWIKREHKSRLGGQIKETYVLTKTTIYSVEPRVDGQVAAADGMFPCALLKPRLTAKQAEEGEWFVPEYSSKDLACYGQLSVYPVASDGVSFVEEPLMIITTPYMSNPRDLHIMNGDASQGLGVTSVFTITPAQGVDPVLMALAVLEFKLRAGPYG